MITSRDNTADHNPANSGPAPTNVPRCEVTRCDARSLSVSAAPVTPAPLADRLIFSMGPAGVAFPQIGNIILVSGGTPMAVDDHVELLTRYVTEAGQTTPTSSVLKIVPTVDGPDALRFGDLLPMFRPWHRRIRASVLTKAPPSPDVEVRAIVSLVREHTGAWGYDRAAGRSRIVIVELDDFCEFVGWAHVGQLFDELGIVASQFKISIVALAHSAAPQTLEGIWTTRPSVPVMQATETDCSTPTKAGSSSNMPPSTSAGSPNEPGVKLTAQKRKPNTREFLLTQLPSVGRGPRPKEIANRIFEENPTKQERARVRKCLQILKEQGVIEVENGGYRSRPSRQPEGRGTCP